jgi:hypothetical protein
VLLQKFNDRAYVYVLFLFLQVLGCASSKSLCFVFVFAGTWVCFFKSSMTGLMFEMIAWMYKQANIAIPTDRLSLAKTMGPVS